MGLWASITKVPSSGNVKKKTTGGGRGFLKLTWERFYIYFKMFCWEFLMLETWTPAVEHCHSVIIEFTISIFKLKICLWWKLRKQRKQRKDIWKIKPSQRHNWNIIKGGGELEIYTICPFPLIFFYKGGREVGRSPPPPLPPNCGLLLITIMKVIMFFDI